MHTLLPTENFQWKTITYEGLGIKYSEMMPRDLGTLPHSKKEFPFAETIGPQSQQL